MNNTVVTDTMALVLRLERRRSSPRVRTLFEDAERGVMRLFVPAMTLAEIGYLSERGRIETTLADITKYCAAYPSIQIMPLTEAIILRSFLIDDIGELHDRLIAGTAATLTCPLLTNDPVIANSRHLEVIW